MATTDQRSVRRSRNRQVEALLDGLAERRRALYRLKAAGAQPAGLRPVKNDFRLVHRQLLEAVEGCTTASTVGRW